jgi:hypothetical protein
MRTVRYIVRKLGMVWTVWDRHINLPINKHNSQEDAESNARRLEAERGRD